MSKLTPKQRAKLPPKAFGLAEKARSKRARKESGNYPMRDRNHAISALRRSERERMRGNLTKDEYKLIQRKAKRILRSTKGPGDSALRDDVPSGIGWCLRWTVSANDVATRNPFPSVAPRVDRWS